MDQTYIVMTSSACEQNGGERGSGDPQENSKKKLKEMDRGREKNTQRKCVTLKKKKKKEEEEEEEEEEEKERRRKKTHTKNNGGETRRAGRLVPEGGG